MANSKINTNFQINDEFIFKFEEMISDEMTLTKTPGMSVAIIQNNRVIYTKGFGARSFERRTPATPDTLYNIASCTKSFISAGILKLQEMNKLNINDPIADYLPIRIGLKGYPISIHHLMCHASGIPSLSEGLSARDDQIVLEDPYLQHLPQIPFASWDDIFRHLNGAQEYISEKPGARFYYLNMGYTLLGRIIEVVSKEKLSDFIKKQLLEPLKMPRSTFIIEEVQKDSNFAQGYKTKVVDTESKQTQLIPIPYFGEDDIGIDFANGGLFSSVEEMANYVIMSMNNGRLDGRQILNPESLDLMQTFQFTEAYPSQPFTSVYGMYGTNGYGYGWAIHDNFHGYKLVHHSGSNTGASAWTAFLPELKIGIVFLANKYPSPRQLALATLMMILDMDPKSEFPLFKIRKHHNKLAGTYKGFKDIYSLDILARNGTLFIKFDAIGLNQALFPIDGREQEFENLDYYLPTEIGGRLPVQFEIDEQETVWLHFEQIKLKKFDKK